MTDRETRRQRAIVIGGSMAGLLAARILSDHYRNVTVLERDAFPPLGQHRRGVPQARHAHGLLASGSEVLERLFPKISTEFIEAGAVTGDIAGDVRWFFEGACLRQVHSGMTGLLMSRPLLEGIVRRRVLALPNVSARENGHVDGLDASGGAVVGLKTRGQVLAADLVVDATGRGSKAAEWLEAIGYRRPPEERIEIALGYTSRQFRRRPPDMDGNVAGVIGATPDGKRGGAMLAQEGDRWMVTLLGYFGHYAPEDLEGFIEFARSLPAPFIYEVVRDAEPLDEPASTRFPASVRRRFEKLDRFPEGFLVFGDAISSFNPIYGQGMSVAALEATDLANVLAAGGRDLARRFFARAAKIVDIAWSIAAGGDLRIPEVAAPRTVAGRLLNWYMGRLHRAAHNDETVALAFHNVGNLLSPPASVLHPRIAARVLRPFKVSIPERRPEAALAGR
jgi:2-polyprenyl-6-methoxyphenol hydroxylase-like FAD-dependent oxidoreductase